MGMGMGMGGGMGMGRMFKYDEKNTATTKITKELAVRVLKYFLPYWKQVVVVLISITASSTLGLVPPILTKNIIDKALPQKDLKLLGLLILASFTATIVLNLFGVLENFLNTWISRYIINDMKNQMYDHLQHMSLGFFSTVKQGDIITRMTSDIGGIQNVFNGTVISIVRNILVLGTTASALVYMNWKLAILGMCVIPLFIAPTRKVGKVRWKIAMQTQQKSAELNQIIQETLSISGSILVKIFTKEKDEFSNFKKLNLETTKLQIKEAMAGRWFGMVLNVFTTMGPMLIYLYGGYLFIHGEISVGAIIAFVALLGRLYGPVGQLSNMHVDVTRSMALFERIFEYFDKKIDIKDSSDAAPLNDIKGSIEFRNVGFSYNEDKQTLKDVTFTVNPGQMVALVGPSGAGKSTITNLIPRLYDANEGEIYIDGVNIKNITLESLRSQIGVVTQDTYLFNGTIRENLLYAKKDATDDEIVEACKAAYIHDFIMGLPQGYDTLVGNRGVKLSGGEKQRVSIARVILKNPKIIIMDEATSSLDTVSESLIQMAIKPLLKNRTSLVIAHRLSTVIAADNLLVVEDGRIVEQGTNDQLLEIGGLYKTLYDRQFKVRREDNESEETENNSDEQSDNEKKEKQHRERQHPDKQHLAVQPEMF